VTKHLHAFRNNATQVPLEITIEVVLIPLIVHSTFNGKEELSPKWWMCGIEECM
jgi:hypothetical protein